MPSFTVFKGSKEGKIQEATTTREIGRDEVLVRITHSGLCGTDEHYLKAGMALGHEGAGLVEEVGEDVKKFKKGQSVGWGYQHDACFDCKSCLTGRETLCPQRAMYGYANFDQASMGHFAVWKAAFLFHVPETMDRADAAPMMCGGATVYSALASFGAQHNHRVGIIGLGGLGHLAIQFAAKMGCQVIVFSSTDSKKAEAISLGATEFVTTKGKDKLEIEPIDHLLICSSVQPDWKLFLPVMAPGGTIYPLTVSHDDLTVPYMPLLSGELSIQGSLVAARQVHRDMLEFAAFHKIRPMIELFPMTAEGITEAFDKLRDGKMRYRGVIVAPADAKLQ